MSCHGLHGPTQQPQEDEFFYYLYSFLFIMSILLNYFFIAWCSARSSSSDFFIESANKFKISFPFAPLNFLSSFLENRKNRKNNRDWPTNKIANSIKTVNCIAVIKII